MAVPLAPDLAPAGEGAPQKEFAPRARGLTSSEVVVAAIAALAVMLAVTVLAGGDGLFARRLWLDEYHTLFMVTRGGLLASARDLAQGADFNPPTLFLLTRLALAITPGDDVVALRLVAFASVCVAIVTTYLLLRRRWSRLPATAGALAVWSQGLVVTHAFEARFYGPWLAFSALFVLALVRLRERPSWPRRAALAAAGVGLCTIHYFGILVWGLVVAADAFGRRRRTTAHYLVPWPALAGPLALAACLPLYLGQRAALSATTWVDPLSATTLEEFLHPLFVWGPLLPLVGLAALSWALGRVAGGRWAPRLGASPVTRSDDAAADVAGNGLVVLAALPLVLIAFSLVAQPATMPRYGIPAALAFAPMVAFLTAAAIRPFQYLILGLILLRSMLAVQGTAWEAASFARRLARVAVDIRRNAVPGETVLVWQRHYLYPLSHESYLGDIRLRMLEYPETARLSAFETVERDAARVHHRLYGFPPIQSAAALGDAPRVLILDRADGRWRDLSPLFPGYRVRRVTPNLLELRPRVAPDSARRVAAGPPGRSPGGVR